MTGLIVMAAAALAGAAQMTNDWENPAVNSIGRLPARTYSMPLADARAALTDALEPETPYKMSLNGTWKLSWAGDPALRVCGFEAPGYDDSAWFDVVVPGCVELQGFGAPGYTNIRYPHAMKPPKILDRATLKGDYNPVSSYRTHFTVPAAWKGREVILRFDGVYSAYYVWVNGKKVGYAEDSKLPSEFDITPHLAAGDNVLAVEVYRWCDGSYLEDQDMFRYSGIFRDVTLWARPKDGIWDFAVKTRLSDDRSCAELAVEGCDLATGELFDPDGKSVGALTAGLKPLLVPNVRLWSAEKPSLYTLVLKKGDDIRMKRIGFKDQKVAGNVFLVNGQPVKLKGVNRHECSPDNGRTVSLDEMVKDIELFKRYNINTVRTSHYPNHRLWYDLCDRYGIYVIAEANVEGHEPAFGENGLGRFPMWDHTIVERNERQALFYRNNVSVTFWSMGNETGHGDCFRHAMTAVRTVDPTRPIHWERGNVDADVDSSMYPTVEWMESRGKLGDGEIAAIPNDRPGIPEHVHTARKPYLSCEYAHAMGNAIGNLQEYWDVIYAHPSMIGGCIWDWIDQAVWKDGDKIDRRTGRRQRVLAYGGDFDEEPNDGPFCCNGVIDPLRNVTAKLVEVGHVYRNLVVTRSETGAGENPFAVVFELWNRFCFTSADEFAADWQLQADGAIVRSGAFETPALKPLARCRFTVPGLAEALAAAPAGAELAIAFTFRTKADCRWAPRGWAVARDQVLLGGDAFAAFAKRTPAAGAAPKVTEAEKTVTVEAGPTKAVFCRRSGTLCELTMNGRPILKDPAPGLAAGPRLTCARAFTDNDRWMREKFFLSGLSQLRWHARPIVVKGAALEITTEVTGGKSAGFTHRATWTFSPDGAIEIANKVEPHGTMPVALPRLGLSFLLDEELENLAYYGRGPRENYVDRKTGSFLGIWKSTVKEQFEAYVRPQDNGCKCDVRWLTLTGADGTGVRFSASEPLVAQALHYDREDLEFARQWNGQKRHFTPLVPTREVRLNLDVRQTGLGGNSCGPRPMEKYQFDPNAPVAWTLRLEPVK